MEAKNYPKKTLSTFQTSTVLTCAKCSQEIKMYTPVVTDSLNNWHQSCAPTVHADQQEVIKTVDRDVNK